MPKRILGKDMEVSYVGLGCKDKPFFNFSGFDEPKSHDTDPNLLLRLIKKSA